MKSSQNSWGGWKTVFCMFAFLLSGCAGSSVGTNPQFDPQPQAEVSHFTPPESPVFEGFTAPEPQIETLPNPPQFTVSEPPPEPDYRPVPVSHRPPPEEPFRRPVAVSHRPPPEEPFRRPVAVSHRREPSPVPANPVLPETPPHVVPEGPVVPVNHCAMDAKNYFQAPLEHRNNLRAKYESPLLRSCGQSRIPGLIPLYDMVSANVSARVAAGDSIKKIGVILDEYDPSSSSLAHGDAVDAAMRGVTRQELFDSINIFGVPNRTVFLGLKGKYDRPIVNRSGGATFRDESCDGPEYRRPDAPVCFQGGITAKDIQSVNAIVVTSAGNTRHPWLNDGPNESERTLREIDILTGSALVVTSMIYDPSPDHTFFTADDSDPVIHYDRTRTTTPLVDKNTGLHIGYTRGFKPRQLRNRCGHAKNYCVAAPDSFPHSAWSGNNGESFNLWGDGGTSFAAPQVTGVLVNLRYVWPHLTNRQLIRLVCETAVDLGEPGNDPIWGCGQFSVSRIWQPTGELVSDPVAEFSLPVASGQMSVSGASFSEPVTVTGYENNEFKRDFEVAVAASDSGTSVRIDPAVSWNSLNSILRFRKNGANSLPLANGRGSATHLFKDTFLFLKGAENSYGALGLSHKSGFSIAFERETDSFFGSVGSGSYKFGDTNKIVASFDRDFQIGKTYNAGLKLATAYGKMEPDISLVKSASGTAQTAQVSIGRKKNNFETRLEMSYSTGLKGEISVQNTNYKLRPRSEKGVVIRMRLAI